jgi:hypothetical protein
MQELAFLRASIAFPGITTLWLHIWRLTISIFSPGSYIRRVRFRNREITVARPQAEQCAASSAPVGSKDAQKYYRASLPEDQRLRLSWQQHAEKLTPDFLDRLNQSHENSRSAESASDTKPRTSSQFGNWNRGLSRHHDFAFAFAFVNLHTSNIAESVAFTST